MANKQHLPPGEAIRRLQNLLKLYSTLGIFTVSLVVASISVFTFYQQLRKEEEKNLKFALHTRSLVIQEFLSRAKDVSLQIASRTQARQILEDYNQRRISQEVATQNITKFLLDALNQSQDIAGITRIALNKELIAQIGLPIPSQFQPQQLMDSTDVAEVPLTRELVAERHPHLNAQK